MIQLTYIAMMLLFISFFFLILNFLISKKSFQDREKISPFECGFDPISPPRMPFSIQFFLISLIFLIFDIEIAILIPLVYMFYKFNFTMTLISLVFILILIFGLFFEYAEQSIDWKV